MASNVPVWFLDVDGVLNAVSRDPSGPWEYTLTRAKGFEIRYAQELIDTIAALHNSGAVEVQWLTTWADDANKILAPDLGLPQFVVAGSPSYSQFGWWKFSVVKRWALENPGRPIVWTDDDLHWDFDSVQWIKDESKRRPLLCITPRTDVGLTRKDMTAIGAFVATNVPMAAG